MNGQSEDKVESLARELFILGVMSAVNRAKEPPSIAEESFKKAEAFYEVADARKLETEK